MDFITQQQLVSYWLDDLNFGYFTKTQVKLWLNNGQKEVQKLLLQAGQNFYVKCVTTPLVVNQQEYILPNDFFWLHRLELILSGTVPNEETLMLQPITVNQQDMFQPGNSTPTAYYIKKNRLVIWPYPDQALTMRMLYSPVVADMVNDSDLPDVPTEYQELIPVLATLDGLFKDGRDPSPFLEKKRYYEELMKQSAQQRAVDVPRSVVNTRLGDMEVLF